MKILMHGIRSFGTGADLELDFEGGLNSLFHVKSFLTLLFSIENTAVCGGYGPVPGSAPDLA